MCILCSVVISALVMKYTSEYATQTLLQQLVLFLCGVLASALQQGVGQQQLITACKTTPCMQ